MSWIKINESFRLGLSTAPRPTDGIRAGVKIYEMDTGATYLYTGLPAPLDWIPWEVGNPTGEGHIGVVSHWSDLIVVTPTIAAAAFSANDVVGGKLTIAGAVRVAAGKGKLDTLDLVDISRQNAALDIHFFGEDLSGTYADNAPEAVTDADWLKRLGCISILPTDYKTKANASLVSMGGIGMGIKAATGTNIYALIVTTGTPTYEINALRLCFGVGEGI